MGIIFSQNVALGSNGHSQSINRSDNLSEPALVQTSSQDKAIPKIEGTVDEIPPRFEFGQQLYLETCATCHVGIPPAVMPTQTWVDLLDDTQHYGVQIPPLVDPGRLIIWQYLEQFSRTLRQEERTPYRIRNSRYFRVLHPRVEFNEPIRLAGCVSCHPGAPDFNYRQLTAEWQDAP
ncbi:MAG: diheme cytochrome C [Leptolyngbyaceae bacterium]|nr:diheme cytochrome C [Leptolyngbyaceae bacterium]